MATESEAAIAAAQRIYAEALFEAAKDDNRLAAVHEAISDFARAIEETPELRSVLKNPQLESSAKAAILADLAGDENVLVQNFLRLVAGKVGENASLRRRLELRVAQHRA